MVLISEYADTILRLCVRVVALDQRSVYDLPLFA